VGRGSVATGLLGLWVRIPLGSWKFVCFECCVLLGRDICVGLITRPEESYLVWCVQCVWSRSPVRRGHVPEWDRIATEKKIVSLLGFASFIVANILNLVISITSASFLHNFVTIRHADYSVRLGKLLTLLGRGACIKFPDGAGIVITDLMNALWRWVDTKLEPLNVPYWTIIW
jgi:hypothetical protein